MLFKDGGGGGGQSRACPCMPGWWGGGERDATAKDCTCMRCSPPPPYPIYGGAGGCWGVVGAAVAEMMKRMCQIHGPFLPQGDSLRRGAVPSLLVGDFHSVPLVIIRLKKIKK